MAPMISAIICNVYTIEKRKSFDEAIRYNCLYKSDFDQERFFDHAEPRSPQYCPELGTPRRLVWASGGLSVKPNILVIIICSLQVTS
jgi:hypothetical protein